MAEVPGQPPEDQETPLDGPAKESLARILKDFRDFLISRASFSVVGSRVTAQDIERAYEEYHPPKPDAVALWDAQAVVAQSLRENRAFEWLAHGMAWVLFLVGLLLLVLGAFLGDAATRIAALCAGGLVEAVILIPFRFAVNSRKHNIALRMLGLILTRVDDPKKIAPLLKNTFLAVVLGQWPPKARS